jgi:hypothetical protein
MADRSIDVFWHDDALLHDTGSGVFEHPPSPLIEVSELHPENDVRVRNIRSCLTHGPIAGRLRWREGRMVLVQEGGYSRSYSAFCMHATLEGVLGTGPLLDDPMAYMPDDELRGDAGIAAARGSMRRYWRL